MGPPVTGGAPARKPDAGALISTPFPSPTDFDSDDLWPISDDFHRPRIEVMETYFGSAPPATAFEPEITKPPIKSAIVLPPTVEVGPSKILRPIPATSVAIGNTTLVPGSGTATLGDGPTKTQIHLDQSGQPVVVVGSSTSTQRVIATIGDTHATPMPSGIIVKEQTLTRGGPPITLGNEFEPITVSVDEIGQTLVVSHDATSTFRMPPTQAFTIDEVTATVLADQIEFALASETLAMEHPITVDNTVISLGTDSAGATVIVAGTTTIPLSPVETDASPIVKTTIISGTTRFIVGSQTLAPGSAITVSGTPISLGTDSGATILVVGTMTTTVGEPSPTSDDQTAEKDQQDSANTKSGSTRTMVFSGASLLALFISLMLG